MTVEFTWYGHSAFEFRLGEMTILVDPFISGNPLCPISPDALAPDLIVLSHGHSDHVGDTVAIAQRTGAGVVANVEVAAWVARQGSITTHGQNTGGTVAYQGLNVRLTPAFHSSSLPDGSYGGSPNGIILTSGKTRIYFAGDTDLFSDMRLIGDRGITAAFLPIGDHYTMGIDDSLIAIGMLRPLYAVPMHFNTFAPIVQNAAEWARRVNNETEATPIVLDPGMSFRIP